MVLANVRTRWTFIFVTWMIGILFLHPMANAADSSMDQDIVTFTRSLTGTPYLKLSADPKRGFDSAGFLSYVYANLGYSIPLTLKEQFALKTETVRSMNDIEVGDALYFSKNRVPEFAGIYLGNQQMAMASLKSDEVVIRDISTNYQEKFLGAKRIISAQDRVKGNLIIDAEKYLGTPYKFGAKVGQTKTFDCSSFLKTIYAENGYFLPRISRDQAKVGKFVSKSDLQSGDLVFFTTRDSENRIGHVGMYVGEGMMIHTYGDGGVRYVSIYKEWWKDHYVTARRIF